MFWGIFCIGTDQSALHVMFAGQVGGMLDSYWEHWCVMVLQRII